MSNRFLLMLLFVATTAFSQTINYTHAIKCEGNVCDSLTIDAKVIILKNQIRFVIKDKKTLIFDRISKDETGRIDDIFFKFAEYKSKSNKLFTIIFYRDSNSLKILSNSTEDYLELYN